MVARRPLGRQFGWLWAAYGGSAFGTWLASVPAAYALGRLGFAQLLVVSVVVAAADITFDAAAHVWKRSCRRRTCSSPTDGSSEVVIWRQDDVLPDDAALFRVAEQVLPTVPGRNAG